MSHLYRGPIRLVLFDIDAVLTDGTLFLDGQGELVKPFNVRDGLAVGLLRAHGILSGVLSGKASAPLDYRIRQLEFVVAVTGRLEKRDAYATPGHESGTDRAAEIARTLGWSDADTICNVQGDEPLVPEDMLRAFAGFCASRKPFSMATISVPVGSVRGGHDPNVVKFTVDVAGDATTFSRAPAPFNRNQPSAEWLPGDYLRHVGIYVYRNDVLQRLTPTPARWRRSRNSNNCVRCGWESPSTSCIGTNHRPTGLTRRTMQRASRRFSQE